MDATADNSIITERLNLNRIGTFLQMDLLRNLTKMYAGKTA